MPRSIQNFNMPLSQFSKHLIKLFKTGRLKFPLHLPTVVVKCPSKTWMLCRLGIQKINFIELPTSHFYTLYL